VAEKLAIILGKATFTMLLSKMAMKVPKMTTLRTDHLLTFASNRYISSIPEACVPVFLLQQAACQKFNPINLIRSPILSPKSQYADFDNIVEGLDKNHNHCLKLKTAYPPEWNE
jgi:hypothetical protein